MKRKFYFHRQNSPLDTDHVIYVLWVGESVREQKMLAKAVAWSFAHGATLRSWSEDIDFYLLLEAERVFPSKGLLDFGFIRTDVGMQELLTLMEDNSFAAYEAALCTPKAFIHQVLTMEPKKIDLERGQIKSSHVLTSSRKNLSPEASHDKFIISFV